MDRDVVERTLPGAEVLSAQELRDVSAKSNEVLAGLGTGVRWIRSHVSGDELRCAYDATDAASIEERARDQVRPVRTVIDPTTAS